MDSRTFRLAPMSTLIRVITLIALAVPVVFLASVALWRAPLAFPAVFLIGLYAWIWLRFRPNRFVVRDDAIVVIWPLKRRALRRAGISAVRPIDVLTLKREAGRCMRVGVGGLWGGFGWLCTARRGIVQMYVSRTDGLVLIERAGDRPWLITPEHPEAFVRALAGEPRVSAPAPRAMTPR